MASNARKVLVPIADGTELMEAVITIDVLRRSGADVTVASAANQLSVQALHGVKIHADASVPDVASTAFNLIALPVLGNAVYNTEDHGEADKYKGQMAQAPSEAQE